MRVIITVVERITSEAHIDIPDGLDESAIKQHIIDLYNSGEVLIDLNIFQVDFESISARILPNQSDINSISA
ncbi:hypothetical protein FNW02_37320 [Komarekiella sp. 'clone 1']|uniref:Uncharacterized protein n=1 Tax=Komarekiella delphini-convector SJRDD-AB1 TaxID=2593771 RepID=A0AA40VVS8_9NOST|nr:hypothetical protein [Komarekiella delphini-convector]MBD6621209.1 hypothetical protein [Komarekiella delphini-convector SJRDD-AB1]